MQENRNTFFVAPFASDGELMGLEPYDPAELSQKWIDVCRDILRLNGSSFRVSPGQKLGHLEIALTSSDGVGLATFYAHGQISSSHALCLGINRQAESQVLDMFVESLRCIDLGKCTQQVSLPFEAVRTIDKRPLWVVVAWGNPSISHQDEELLRELSTHFAAAFLTTE